MNCPKCGLINPETALRCDCGYGFQFKMPPLKELLDLPEVEGLRWLIDLPRPRQVKKEWRWRYLFFFLIPVVIGLGMVAVGYPRWGGLILLVLFIYALIGLNDLESRVGITDLLANGNVTFGKIVNAKWVGNLEAELGWRLDYKFADSKGMVHTAAYEYADEEEWQGQVGDVLPVFYDNSNPSRNYLLLDLDRIVRPMPSRESS